MGPETLCGTAILRSIRSESNVNCALVSVGVATISVVPDSAAIFSMATASSSVFGPSSSPAEYGYGYRPSLMLPFSLGRKKGLEVEPS